MTRPEETAITQAVIDRFAQTPDPRLKAIVTHLTRSLHAFVQEVEPTFDEWLSAIGFLTDVGRKCTESRQEFILLSDTLGVSMLVDAINHRQARGATESTVLGPFFVDTAPTVADGADISGGVAGEPLYVEAAIGDLQGRPIAGASVDVWQSDTEGFYDVQRKDLATHVLRARLTSGPDGKVRFWSILPTAYPIPDDGPVGRMLKATGRHPWRPAHLHFKIGAQGHSPLVTHLFVRGGAYLDSDAVFGVKDTLVCDFPRHAPGQAPDGRTLDRPWRSLQHAFVLDGI
jgi:hydroxyquinol 1,2-dioxygenase